MFTKMGNKFPNSGQLYAAALSDALNRELGQSHRAIKTLRQWTDADERTVKHWLAGTHGPSGAHLITLVQHSDTVLETILNLAQRRSTRALMALPVLRDRLIETLALLDACVLDELPAASTAQDENNEAG
jgi:hypothetical protein